jgi:hypothetical protein
MSDELLRAHARYVEAENDVTRLLSVVEALEAQIADSLDAAWAEAEAALPEERARWRVGVSEKAGRDYQAYAQIDGAEGGNQWWADGPTPAAALCALAAKWRATA